MQRAAVHLWRIESRVLFVPVRRVEVEGRAWPVGFAERSTAITGRDKPRPLPEGSDFNWCGAHGLRRLIESPEGDFVPLLL